MAYKLWHSGQLEGYAVGRRKLVYVDSIDAYKQRNSNAQPAEPEHTPEPEAVLPMPRRGRRKGGGFQYFQLTKQPAA
jgi:hypothetical protein